MYSIAVFVGIFVATFSSLLAFAFGVFWLGWLLLGTIVALGFYDYDKRFPRQR